MAFSEQLKVRVRQKCRLRCCICHNWGVDIHHIVPQAEGGEHTEENAAPLCPSCHRLYGGNPELRKSIRETRDLWYHDCERAYAPIAPELKELRNLIEQSVNRGELEAKVREILTSFNDANVSEKEVYQELHRVTARLALASATDSNFAFFGGGRDSSGNASSQVDIFDSDSGWWFFNNLNQARFGHAATSLKSKIFFAGGLAGSDNRTQTLDTIEIFDLNTNSWSEAKLTQKRHSLTAISSSSKAFFAGGSISSQNEISSAIDIYDAETDRWSLEELSIARTALAAATAGSVVAFAGGLAGQKILDVVDLYDSKTEKKSVGKLSIPRMWLAGSGTGDFIAFAGGNTEGGLSDLVDIYNAKTAEWTTAHLSQPRAGLTATAVDNKILFAGGYCHKGRGSFGLSSAVDIYDCVTGEWSTATLSQPRANLTSATVEHLAIFVGGDHLNDGSNSASGTVDFFNSKSMDWSTIPP